MMDIVSAVSYITGEVTVLFFARIIVLSKLVIFKVVFVITDALKGGMERCVRKYVVLDVQEGLVNKLEPV